MVFSRNEFILNPYKYNNLKYFKKINLTKETNFTKIKITLLLNEY